MIIFLPVGILFIINSIFLGSQSQPEWPQAIGFFLIGLLLIIGYCREIEPDPSNPDEMRDHDGPPKI